MRRFVLSSPPDERGRVEITGKDARYLGKVLRMKRGDQLRAVLPAGNEVTLILQDLRPGVVLAELVSAPPSMEDGAPSGSEADVDRKRAQVAGDLPSLMLLQALPKGQKMDLIVRQAAELGVAAVIPFVADHSVSRVRSAAEADDKRSRWQRIVKEARQQSGSSVLTEIHPPQDLASALDLWRSLATSRSVALVLHQDPLARGSAHDYLSGCPDAVCVAVGPEGGFSGEEIESFLAADFHPLLLGPNVLRTETAALCAISSVEVIVLERASWNPKP